MIDKKLPVTIAPTLATLSHVRMSLCQKGKDYTVTTERNLSDSWASDETMSQSLACTLRVWSGL